MQDVFERDDELSIPAAGFELPRRTASGSNRRLAIIATVIGVVLVGIGGGLELASHRSSGVPVITADSRPIRVRPDNPGGMQVIGANEGDADNGKEAMAPPAENPDTRALQAQRQAELAARAQPGEAALPSAALLSRPGSAAPDVPLPPGADVPALPASASSTAPAPAAVTPPPPPRTIAPAPARAAVVAPAPAATGHHVVQLAAVGSEEAANSEWQRLARRMPDLLAGRQPEIIRFEHDGRTFWRLRTGGFADTAEATTFCDRVRGKGASCAVF